MALFTEVAGGGTGREGGGGGGRGGSYPQSEKKWNSAGDVTGEGRQSNNEHPEEKHNRKERSRRTHFNNRKQEREAEEGNEINMDQWTALLSKIKEQEKHCSALPSCAPPIQATSRKQRERERERAGNRGECEEGRLQGLKGYIGRRKTESDPISPLC